jgi:hypothetical protein
LEVSCLHGRPDRGQVSGTSSDEQFRERDKKVVITVEAFKHGRQI